MIQTPAVGTDVCRRQAGLLVFLGGLTSLTAMSVDVSLPAVPGLAERFEVDVSRTHAIVSLFLLGYAVMQPIYGPLSDRVGRKPALLIGLAIFWFASLACMYAQSIEQLFFARFAQGVGAGCGPILARAILRDCYDGKAAERAMAMVMFMMALGPMIAPVIGGALTRLWGAMAAFGFLVAVSFAFLLISAFWFRETHNREQMARKEFSILGGYRRVLSDQVSRSYMLAGGFVYGTMLCYISASPAVVIEGFGTSPQTYGFLFGMTASALLVGSILNARLLMFIRSQSMSLAGGILTAIGALAMLVGAMTDQQNTLSVFLPAVMCVFGLSIALPNTTVLAMKAFKDIAGTASAAIGSIQITTGLSLGFIVGALYDGTALPMAIGMVLASGLMLVFLWQALRHSAEVGHE